jgi:hypothetical protein
MQHYHPVYLVRQRNLLQRV